jgi:hypothetical protein
MLSALILLAIALGAATLTGPVGEEFLHGLKLVAVAEVAQGIWAMTRAHARSGERRDCAGEKLPSRRHDWIGESGRRLAGSGVRHG